jgi:DNA helicase-2/ATP-dependent DNA helicase PcrA
MDFKQRYGKLNGAQKLAVDTIDGPVIVVAGPGTGKTELLSIRVANILKLTDTLPENILCLTFTDSGANAMRKRLTGIIGKEAYKVAIHTFHSFGTEVINQNGQYFYQGANFRPADELSRYEIIRNIFKELRHNSLIGAKLNDEYTHLNDSLGIISELKRSGLTNEELIKILDQNDLAIQKTEQLISPIVKERVNKATVDKLAVHIDTIRNINEQIDIPTIVPLSQIIADSLEKAVDEAQIYGKTTHITAWKNEWFKKDEHNNFILKSHERQAKLREICFVYGQYLTRMQEASLYDFDDMILRVVHAMEIFGELRFNLQEKYQYIMVDEFQDTNLAQMRILYNLTNNEINGDSPNILVVGDDDQAIYSFQGADISNILDFRKVYPLAKQVILTDNYRSSPQILEASRNIITQGHERLENLVQDLNKNLTSHQTAVSSVVDINEAATSDDERRFIVESIKADITSGQKPNEITVLTRRHNEIQELLPYFTKSGISVNYERRDNVLDVELIILLEKLAKFILALAECQHDQANAYLPEILANPAWAIEPVDLWKISTKAYDGHVRWLDILGTMEQFIPLQTWFINCAAKSQTEPLEHMLDILIGKIDEQAEFISPLYQYYFADNKLHKNPDEYIVALEALRTIRTKLREYKPDETPTLSSFIEFITLNRKIGSKIGAIRKTTNNENSVNIMTAHSSKGLEFDTVYVMNAIDTAWGERARSRGRLISYPENLPFAPSGESSDERLRLFFVAVTRAKRNLHISYSLNNDSGKNTMRASFLVDSKLQNITINSPTDSETTILASEMAWYQPIVKPISPDMKAVVMPMLDNYKLSVTHLNNFLDITRGGPSAFLMQNVLRFPTAKSPSAAFGTAIHDTLQKAHAHYSSTKNRQAIEDIILIFDEILGSQHLLPSDFDLYQEKGNEALRIFLEEKYSTFNINDQSELNFAGQHSIVETAHLTGKLDLVVIDKINKTIHVTDYKTGKPPTSSTGKTEFEKIKLHKYRQQLQFYKLLIEAGRDYRGYTVTSGSIIFVEPTKRGDIVSIDVDFNTQDTEQLKKLIGAVWRHIINLNLPEINTYEQTLKGILKFEQDLIDNIL